MAHEHSHLTQAEFCRRNALALSTFQYWRRRLRDDQVDEAEDMQFIEVSWHESPTTAGDDPFELTFPSGVRLKVPRQVEGRALAEVLWALEATGTC
jgi:hypothetical protein